MITQKEAYSIFRKKFPEAKYISGYDYGDFYVFSPTHPGDFVWEDYKMDKVSGKIEKFSELEYLSLPEEIISNVIEIHDSEERNRRA